MARVGEQAPLEPVRAGITPRELEVLRCIVLRLSNREIADRLVVSVRTVESHVPALLTKLGATTRRELATRGATLLEQPATATGSGLPVALNRFVGRARELGEVAALLSSGRLVTLTGPAGMGKTRLALEVGRASGERYDGGVRVVDLTPARQDAEIADRVLAALGVAQVPGQPALDTLANDGPGRPVLVVLDNCEHVLAGCAVVVAKLLGHWPSAGVLATSREPLGVSGETVYPVRPLAVPDPEITQLADVVSSEAVQPLADRAGRAGAGFEVTDANAAAVALLCRRLDGLPLALELLAPRLRTFTAGQLVERLDDRLDLLATGAPGVPSRHRTLRRAIDWSFESLSGPERSLLTGLAIFAGSFSIDAVEAVCTESNVVETLPLLVDRSLVVAVPAGATNRYRLLETLRAYAHERLDPQTERSLAGRHAHHFLEFAERAEPRLRSARAPEWLDRLRAEQDNLDAALQWALAHRPADALRLVTALYRYWENTDQRRSGVDWAERALATNPAPSALRLQAVLATATLVAPWDATRLGELAADADRLARQLGDERSLAYAKLCLAMAKGYAMVPAQLDTNAAEDAVRYFRGVGDHWHTATGLQALAVMQPSERALRSLDEARRLYSAEGDRLMDANCAFMMAAILVRDLGNVAPAQQLARDSLGVFEKLGSEHEQAHARSVLAEIDYRRDRTPQAADVAHDCLQTFRRAADHRCESAMLLLLARIEQDQGDRDMAVRLLRETLDVAASGAHARTLPLAVERLARLFSQDQPLAAVALFAAVDAYRDTSARSSKPERAAELDTLRHATQPEAFDAAWQRGARVPRRDHGLTLTNCGKVAAGLGHPDAARAVAWRTGRTRSRSSWRATG